MLNSPQVNKKLSFKKRNAHSLANTLTKKIVDGTKIDGLGHESEFDREALDTISKCSTESKK